MSISEFPPGKADESETYNLVDMLLASEEDCHSQQSIDDSLEVVAWYSSFLQQLSLLEVVAWSSPKYEEPLD